MKKTTYLIAFILFTIMLCSFSLIKTKKATSSCTYIDKGSSNDDNFWLTAFCSSVYDDLVNTTDDAARLSYVYASRLYGEKIAKIEQPYNIRLINDSIWYVWGTSRPRSKYKKWKGNFYIAINKNTGALMAYMHEK